MVKLTPYLCNICRKSWTFNRTLFLFKLILIPTTKLRNRLSKSSKISRSYARGLSQQLLNPLNFLVISLLSLSVKKYGKSRLLRFLIHQPHQSTGSDPTTIYIWPTLENWVGNPSLLTI